MGFHKTNIYVYNTRYIHFRQMAKSDERTNRSQFRALVGFLERNVNLAKGLESSSAR